MALDRIYTTTNHRPIFFFMSLEGDSGLLDLDAPYQRGDVWSLQRRQNLFKSLILGIPVPSVVLNERHAAKFHEAPYDDTRNNAYAVIDGKQRITTVLMFTKDKFGLPAEWLHEDDVETVADDGLVYWSGMTRRGRSGFKMNLTIGVVETRLPNLDEEARVFDLINFGGVAQGETDDEPFDWSN